MNLRFRSPQPSTAGLLFGNHGPRVSLYPTEMSPYFNNCSKTYDFGLSEFLRETITLLSNLTTIRLLHILTTSQGHSIASQGDESTLLSPHFPSVMEAQRASGFIASRREMRIRRKHGRELTKDNLLGHELNQECKRGSLLPDPDLMELDSPVPITHKSLQSHLPGLASPRRNFEWCWAPVYTRGCQRACFPARSSEIFTSGEEKR